MNTNRKFIRNCLVPICRNNSKDHPEKLFFSPSMRVRLKWCLALGVKPSYSSTDCYCEDHFDLSKDIKNWIGRGNAHYHFHDNVVPHINIRKTDEKHIHEEKKDSIKLNSTFTKLNEQNADDEIPLSELLKKIYLGMGLPKETNKIVKYIQSKVKVDTRVVLLTLKKIIHNDSYHQLAEEFYSYKSEVRQIFTKAVPVIASVMLELIHWPKKKTKTTPLILQRKHKKHKKALSIIDCFEINGPTTNDDSSSPKTHLNTTLKYLLSATPDGYITFISTGHDGRISGKQIIQNNGYLSVIPEGTIILGDRYFTCDSKALSKIKCTLARPKSYTRYIYRIMNKLRKFKMLGSYFQGVQQDHIVTIAAGIINWQNLHHTNIF